LLACAGLLAGCASISKPPELEPGIDDPAAWQEHQAALEELDTWSRRGRAATGKALGWAGDVGWRQRGDHFDVRLSGPLGSGGFRAFGTLDEVTVITDREKRVTRHPRRLLRRSLEWDFPLRPLRYWALGLPAPGDYRAISVDDRGLLTGLEQQQWQISYLGYSTAAGRPPLPERIVLDNGETRVRLVVSRWFNLAQSSTED